ncbi:MAG: hypothetical protein Fur007_18630 [Rhodoferax sp.]
MHRKPVEKSFCTTREAADLLGVSVGTVQMWAETGVLQAWKTSGGHRRVMRDSIERLLHKAPQAPTPLHAEAGVSGPTLESVAPAQRRLRIMVVEDDATLLRLYGLHLRHWPMAHELSLLNNAFTALLQLGRQDTDLLILDLHMPGTNGFDLLRVLRQAHELERTTIVVVTGLDAASIAERGGLPSGIEILPKPVPFDQLLSIATGIVNRPEFLLAAA